MKEHKILGQTQVSKVTLHFVGGRLSRKQTVQRVIKIDIKVEMDVADKGCKSIVFTHNITKFY